LSLAGCSNDGKATGTNTPPPKPLQKEVDQGAPATEAAAGDGDRAASAGPRVAGQGFVVEVQPPVSASVGAAAAAQVVLKPTDGYHLNKDFPTHLEVTPPAGCEVDKAKQTPEDAARFEESGAEFAVRFTSRDAGAKRFTASFRFAVCTATTCVPKRETLAWNVDVK
jgi:hypothetical protein